MDELPEWIQREINHPSPLNHYFDIGLHAESDRKLVTV
jgi:hypothetical protein